MDTMQTPAPANGDNRIGLNHSPLTQLVVDALREKILSGAIAPGERLVEGRLSEEFSVSRMPVREALRQLAACGLVTIEPRRGASVTQFERGQLRELVEVRATLEALNAKLAAQRHDPAQIADLEALLRSRPSTPSWRRNATTRPRSPTWKPCWPKARAWPPTPTWTRSPS